jgi:hypothetical protein
MEPVTAVLKRIRENANSAFDQILLIQQEINKLLEAQQLLVDVKHGESLFTGAFSLTLSNLFGDSNKPAGILNEEAMKAIEDTEEYDLPIFKNGLSEAIYDPETIKIERKRGFNLGVRITLSKTAGDLGDWARAVSETRSALGVDVPGDAPGYSEFASKVWKKKIYGVDREGGGEADPTSGRNTVAKYAGLYFKTINLRIGFSKAKAAWWGLLDKGNAIGLASDLDPKGTAYPKNAPTHFVQKARTKITILALNIFEKYVLELQEKIQRSIDNINQTIFLLREQADNLTKSIEYDVVKINQATVENLIRSRFAGEPLNADRIRRIAIEIKSGNILTKRPIVGTALDGKRLRVYSASILKQYNRLIGR